MPDLWLPADAYVAILIQQTTYNLIVKAASDQHRMGKVRRRTGFKCELGAGLQVVDPLFCKRSLQNIGK
eukprot:gene14986-4456_t